MDFPSAYDKHLFESQLLADDIGEVDEDPEIIKQYMCSNVSDLVTRKSFGFENNQLFKFTKIETQKNRFLIYIYAELTEIKGRRSREYLSYIHGFYDAVLSNLKSRNRSESEYIDILRGTINRHSPSNEPRSRTFPGKLKIVFINDHDGKIKIILDKCNSGKEYVIVWHSETNSLHVKKGPRVKTTVQKLDEIDFKVSENDMFFLNSTSAGIYDSRETLQNFGNLILNYVNKRKIRIPVPQAPFELNEISMDFSKSQITLKDYILLFITSHHLSRMRAMKSESTTQLRMHMDELSFLRDHMERYKDIFEQQPSQSNGHYRVFNNIYEEQLENTLFIVGYKRKGEADPSDVLPE